MGTLLNTQRLQHCFAVWLLQGQQGSLGPAGALGKLTARSDKGRKRKPVTFLRCDSSSLEGLLTGRQPVADSPSDSSSGSSGGNDSASPSSGASSDIDVSELAEIFAKGVKDKQQ